jgi:hypothetical protein
METEKKYLSFYIYMYIYTSDVKMCHSKGGVSNCNLCISMFWNLNLNTLFVSYKKGEVGRL